MCRVTHRALHEAACVANTCFVVLGDLGPDTPFDDLGLPADTHISLHTGTSAR